jgi:hypothetical protein
VTVVSVGPVLAAESGKAGSAGLLIVLLLCAVAALLFVGMSRSLRRMRSNVGAGQFADQRRRSGRAAPGGGDGTDTGDGGGAGMSSADSAATDVTGGGTDGDSS